MSFKKFLLYFFLVVALLGVGGLWYGKWLLDGWLNQTANEITAGTGTKITGVSSGLTGLSIDRIDTVAEPLKSVKLRWHLPSILQGKLGGTATASIAGGSAVVELANVSSASGGTIRANLTGMKLAELVRLQGLGVTAGELGLELSATLGPSAVSSLQGTFSLVGGAKPNATIIPGFLLGRSEGLAIPAFSDLNLSLALSASESASTVKIERLTSSLGTGEGSIVFSRSTTQVPIFELPPERVTAAGEVYLRLTPLGAENLGPILRELSDGAPIQGITNYLLRFSGTAKRLQITLEPAGGTPPF